MPSPGKAATSLGGLTTAARYGPYSIAARARRGLDAKLRAQFEAEINPESTLPPADREKRWELWKRAYYTRLRLRGIRKTRKKKRSASGR